MVMNNVKFAIIEMKTDFCDLKSGAKYKALIAGLLAWVCDDDSSLAVPFGNFVLIKEFSEDNQAEPKEINSLSSLMGSKIKSAHFEFTE